MAAPGFNRSFSQQDVGYQQHGMDKPQIYTVRAQHTGSHDLANIYRPSTRA
jgi:hypothetical protein